MAATNESVSHSEDCSHEHDDEDSSVDAPSIPIAAVAFTAAQRRAERALVTLECPRAFVGRILGKRGETIKALQTFTGTKIQVNQALEPCQCVISGAPENLSLAASMVQDIINGTFKGFSLLREAAQPQSTSSSCADGAPSSSHQHVDDMRRASAEHRRPEVVMTAARSGSFTSLGGYTTVRSSSLPAQGGYYVLSHAPRPEQQAVFLDPGGEQAGPTYFQAAPAAPQFLQLADGSTVAVSAQPQPQYQLVTSVGGGYPQLVSVSGQPATYVHTTGPPQLVTIGGGAPQLVSMVGGQPQLLTTLGSGTMPQLVTIQQGAGSHHAHPQLVTIGGAVHHATVPQPLAPGPRLVGSIVPGGQPKVQMQQHNSSGQPPVLRAASSTSVGLSMGPGGQLYYTPSQQS